MPQELKMLGIFLCGRDERGADMQKQKLNVVEMKMLGIINHSEKLTRRFYRSGSRLILGKCLCACVRATIKYTSTERCLRVWESRGKIFYSYSSLFKRRALLLPSKNKLQHNIKGCKKEGKKKNCRNILEPYTHHPYV